MAVVFTMSNHYKYQLSKGKINLSSDTLIAIMMNNTFAFDEDAHATLDDITVDQLATGNGYTQNNKELTTKSLAEDDTNDEGVMTCDDVTWTASGGNIGPSGAAVLLDFSALDDTEFFTTANDRTFAAGSTNWANGDLGTTFDDGPADLSLVSSATGQYCKITFTDIGTALVAGGRYRLTYDYTENLAGYEFKLEGVATQSLGDAVAGTEQYIDFIADESFTGAHELRIFSKTNAAASGDFDNFSIKKIATVIGCVDYGADYTITDGLSFALNNIEIAAA